MLKTEKKEINGHVYSITQFTASEGLPIRARINEIDSGNVAEILKLLSKTTRDDEIINKNTFDKFFTNDYEEITELMDFVLRFNFLSKRGTGNLLEKPAQD